MSNKKQSSIDWLVNCITEDQMVKSKSLNQWLEIFEQAKAMHKEEIIDAFRSGLKSPYHQDYHWEPQQNTGTKSEHYYKETFEK